MKSKYLTLGILVATLVGIIFISGCIERGPEDPVKIYDSNISGIIKQDQIWSGTIHIIGDIEVKEGVILIISPGTTIFISANNDSNNLFGDWSCDNIQNYDLLVGIKEEDNAKCGVHKDEPYRDEVHHISVIIKGTLKAIGNEDNRISFKSGSPNPTIYDWNRLEIHNGVLSYADIENYRILETKGDDVEISHNNLRNIGECGICANSRAKILHNKINNAGHELIDMHSSSPIIANNTIGPNNDRSCITIDGGAPKITDNTIEGCGSGISMIAPPSNPNLENNILRDNTFLNNGNDIMRD